MSRVGKNPISIPLDVNCIISSNNTFLAEGNLGSLNVSIPSSVNVTIKDRSVFISPSVENKKNSMIWGTIRSLISNAVIGVHKGFSKTLEINGVGYRSYIKSGCLILNLGYSHEISYSIPKNIKIVCKKPTLVDISGVDRQLVGQVASKIRAFRKPEPYKGKGIKYIDEIIFRKEGKKK